MPSATFRHATTSTASPTEIWTALQDPDVWATVAGAERTWNRASDNSGGLSGFDFETRVGGSNYSGTATVTRAEPHERITLAINSSHLTGSIDVSIVPVDTATSIDISMNMQSVGFLTSLAFPAISIAVENGFARSVEQLAHRIG